MFRAVHFFLSEVGPRCYRESYALGRRLREKKSRVQTCGSARGVSGGGRLKGERRNRLENASRERSSA